MLELLTKMISLLRNTENAKLFWCILNHIKSLDNTFLFDIGLRVKFVMSQRVPGKKATLFPGIFCLSGQEENP